MARGKAAYAAEELTVLWEHVAKYFGTSTLVLPDKEDDSGLTVDVEVIPPSSNRNYYTLVTIGMGAYRMDMPERLREYHLDRAELLICLPPDWRIDDPSPQWQWPVAWLHKAARMPAQPGGEWLGWGRLVDAGAPVAPDMAYTGFLLMLPDDFGPKAAECRLSDGEYVRFYQLAPLYAAEIAYGQAHDANALIDRFDGEFSMVVTEKRKLYC